MCSLSKHDTKFTMDGDLVDTRHTFRGFTDSLIFWNMSGHLWHLEFYHDKTMYALNPEWEFPLGTYLWTVYNEPCYGNKPTTVPLSLNSCNETEFNCNNGFCIELDKRCNGQPDCLDKTGTHGDGFTLIHRVKTNCGLIPDEQDCEIIRMGDTYLTEVAPPEAYVTMDTDILSVMELNENSQFVKLQMDIRLTWKDSRLKLINLHKDENLNTLTKEDKLRIWKPRLLFFNSEDKMTTIADDETVITIMKNGSYQIAGMDKLWNEHIYKGSENPIEMAR